MIKKEKSKAGRKPIDDKKVTVNLFIRQSVINQVGKENIKNASYEAIKNLTK